MQKAPPARPTLRTTPRAFSPVPRTQPTESDAWIVDPTDPLTLYALGERSMRSRDGGHTWAELDWPANAQSLAFTEQPAPALYLRVSGASGTSSDALLESLDGGDSWANTDATAVPSDLVVVDEHDGPVLLGLQDDHVVRSTDKGATWVASVVPPATVIALVLGRLFVSRQATPVVYLQAVGPTHDESSTQYGPHGGVYVTNDAGGHFTTLLTVPPPQQAMCAAIGNSDPPAIYVYVTGKDRVADEIWASLDGGATWASSPPGAPGAYVTSLVVDPADPQVAFWVPLRVSGEEGAALRTLDGGVTWERVADESEEFVSLHFDPRAPHALYAVGQHLAEDGGWHNVLHSSEDHGDTWHTVTELPAGQRDFELAPNAGGARYVLSESGLLYKMTE